MLSIASLSPSRTHLEPVRSMDRLESSLTASSSHALQLQAATQSSSRCWQTSRERGVLQAMAGRRVKDNRDEIAACKRRGLREIHDMEGKCKGAGVGLEKNGSFIANHSRQVANPELVPSARHIAEDTDGSPRGASADSKSHRERGCNALESLLGHLDAAIKSWTELCGMGTHPHQIRLPPLLNPTSSSQAAGIVCFCLTTLLLLSSPSPSLALPATTHAAPDIVLLSMTKTTHSETAVHATSSIAGASELASSQFVFPLETQHCAASTSNLASMSCQQNRPSTSESDSSSTSRKMRSRTGVSRPVAMKLRRSGPHQHIGRMPDYLRDNYQWAALPEQQLAAAAAAARPHLPGFFLQPAGVMGSTGAGLASAAASAAAAAQTRMGPAFAQAAAAVGGMGTTTAASGMFVAGGQSAASAAAGGALIDGAILRASLMASAKLFSACGFVAWMQRTGKLPESTPSILSKVAYNLIIPCFLLSKVSATLAAQSSAALLSLPFVSILQILSGFVLGKLVCAIAYHRGSFTLPGFSNANKVPLPVWPNSISRFLPQPASQQVAASVAASAGLPNHPSAAEALEAPAGMGSVAKPDARKEGIITAACAFGNTVTLPLVFLSSILGPAEADAAAGYLALFMIGWSPALWTFGLSTITGGEEEKQEDETKAVWQQMRSTAAAILTPPVIGVLLGMLIGCTPLSHLFMPRPPLPTSADTMHDIIIPPMEAIGHLTAGCLHPIMEVISLFGSAAVAVQTIVLASSLAKSIPTSFSFPSQFRSLFPLSSPRAALIPIPVPLEARLRQLYLNPDGDITRTGSDISSIVANSMGQFSIPELSPSASSQYSSPPSDWPQSGAISSPADATFLPPTSESAFPSNTTPPLPPTLSPSLDDGRALWVICSVRLLLLPLLGMATTLSLRHFHVIPQDPICSLVLLVQCAMPSAQNLVLMSQLKPSTQSLAGVLASIMLKQYALAIVPITFWIAVFLAII